MTTPLLDRLEDMLQRVRVDISVPAHDATIERYALDVTGSGCALDSRSSDVIATAG
jgi:hypothetical protein